MGFLLLVSFHSILLANIFSFSFLLTVPYRTGREQAEVDQAATPDEATGHEAGATDDAAPTEAGHRKRKRKQHRAQASYHRRKQKNQRT